ncbi:MAG: nodulation protein NfeD [Veillonellaceae bacterium]|nr:nodulation protein NfeD [Veillonellaceae bacterium]
MSACRQKNRPIMPDGRIFRQCFLLVCLFFFCCQAVAAAGPALLVPIRGEVNPGTVSLVRRAVEEAERTDAAAIIFRLDTPGGRLDSAIQIRDLLLQEKRPTVAYVEPRAWSAGALIALAAERIVMAPGSSLGAAEPIPATEKLVAAVRGEFAATAEARNRDAASARAMVDKTLGYPPYAAPGAVLSLTAEDAARLGLATAAGEITEITAAYPGTPLTVAADTTDNLVAFLQAPWLRVILIAVLFFSLFAEVKTAGFSGAGILALAAGGLLLFGEWQVSGEAWAASLLIGGGFLLVLADIFFFFSGIAALLGFIGLLGGVFLVLGGGTAAWYILAAGLIGAVILFVILAKHLTTGRLWRRLALQTASTTEAGYTGSDDFSYLCGARGRTLTPLRPAGTALIDGRRYDVVTAGEFIPAERDITVIEVSGARIVVAAQI